MWSRREFRDIRSELLSLLFVLMLCTVPATIRAQDQSSASQPGSVFAPYVSRLRIATKDPLVQLTWQEPEGLSGTGQGGVSVRIYRSEKAFTAATFSEATQVGTAAPGVMSFLDIPTRPGKYYYAVLVERPGNGVYEIFVPFRNMTLEPITIARTATEQQLAATVTGITVSRKDNEVFLTFKASRSGRTLAVYRGTTAILTSDALSNSTRIQEVASTADQVTDYPVPGVPYYYAVVDTALLTGGEVELKSGENVTTAPVEVPLGEQTIGIPTQPLPPRRSTPLPYLILQEGVQNGSSLAPSLNVPSNTTALNDKTLKAVDSLIAAIPVTARPPLKPVVLAEDRVATDKGAEYTLKGIVETQFAGKEWKETVSLLDKFLTLPVPDDVRARAQFYLGQAYYFQGLYKQSFLAFLMARDRYYTETRPWIDAILEGNPVG